MMNITNNLQQKLQFSSKKTGVSITLPIGWYKEIKEDTDYPTDIYYQSSGEPFSPCITIKIIQIPEVEYHQNNYQQLSEIMLAEQAQHSFSQPLEILEQLLENIDNHSARIDIFKMIDEETQIPITQYQLTVQLNTAVFGLIAIMKTEEQDNYLPIFNEAVQSIKFN
ncbi:MAG: hypothetical protein AN483_20525 [Aphanizomenon flos-aquae MDT14a]|jgi:hypothetical protein|uniref:PsbP C-terminal domain-containing protein n=1 Tax=Aphanizomenon flos-aquae WA102 TaxID=1710896 RepID=A0A1B7WZH1_APHFL|nr:MAG: hypothetical protein AN483_20525 [Aphanizomenon flos-aquae MDT14a]OBQ42493.1 MAG: hypothetical protein AN484_17495 [Aphanizomenon flos-aquae WA102]